MSFRQSSFIFGRPPTGSQRVSFHPATSAETAVRVLPGQSTGWQLQAEPHHESTQTSASFGNDNTLAYQITDHPSDRQIQVDVRNEPKRKVRSNFQ